MTRSLRTPTAQLLLGAALGAATGAAYLIGGRPAVEAAIVGLAVFALMVLVVVARRRSDTFDVMSGIGDERTRDLYQRAVAFAGTMMSFVLPGWWLVTIAQGDPNATLSALCAIFGLTFIGAVIVLSRRS